MRSLHVATALAAVRATARVAATDIAQAPADTDEVMGNAISRKTIMRRVKTNGN